MRLARRAVLIASGLCGVRYEVRGGEHIVAAGSYVFVPNHNSPLDIPAMVVARPDVNFVAAAELFSNPVLRFAMDALGTVRLDRDDKRLAAKQLAAAASGDHLRLVIFAEGGLQHVHDHPPFKSGAFVLAIDADATIVPVAIHGAGHVVPKGGLYGIRRGRVVIELLDPIPTAGVSRADRKAVRTETEQAVRAALVRPV
jgi:1-acyl-sn-glycerol-3-phosphate acyltransferase